jgi:hypothetical protein
MSTQMDSPLTHINAFNRLMSNLREAGVEINPRQEVAMFIKPVGASGWASNRLQQPQVTASRSLTIIQDDFLQMEMQHHHQRDAQRGWFERRIRIDNASAFYVAIWARSSLCGFGGDLSRRRYSICSEGPKFKGMKSSGDVIFFLVLAAVSVLSKHVLSSCRRKNRHRAEFRHSTRLRVPTCATTKRESPRKIRRALRLWCL